MFFSIDLGVILGRVGGPGGRFWGGFSKLAGGWRQDHVKIDF